MVSWRNDSGKPLSSLSWLEAHHAAKLVERTEFVKAILSRKPRRIVDLGCGPGIWLDLISHHADLSCELYGIDADKNALLLAHERSARWPQKKHFEYMDLDTQARDLPEADVYLAFNIFPYVKRIDKLLETVRGKLTTGGVLVVRQYDGALLRLGPMDQRKRFMIDSALQASVLGSTQFRHYDMDRVFETINDSSFKSKTIEFDTFQRVAPYPREFVDYFYNSVQWISDLVSEEAQEGLVHWLERVQSGGSRASSYCVETEMVAWLS